MNALGFPEMSKECLNMYFKGKPPANQFLIRAYLCGGQLTSLQSSGRAGDIEKVVMFFLKAIEISKEQPRYHFLVFNASVLYFQAIGPFLRPGTKQHLVSSLMQVVKALEDIREEDLKWRAQLMLFVPIPGRRHLVECLVDAGRKKEAASFAKLTSDFAQVNTPDLYPRIFSLQVLRLESGEAGEDDDIKLKEIFRLLTSSTENSSSIPLTDRFVPLQLPTRPSACVAANAQLKMVKRLDHSLQSAVRGGGRSLVQAVCATLWNACLPLLQLNLRKSIKGQLVRMAQALEESRSLLLEMRFQVHNEISEMEVEEDHLECAIEHLEKAMRLDEEGMHRERLSATLRQLRARRSLYEMPDRAEDRAALLIEQAKRGSPKNDVKKIRSLLINAGKALAPDAFQVLLEADVEAKGKREESVVDQLVSKARHHTTCLKAADRHLKQQGSANDSERLRLWAVLAKTARKRGLWDVCRAACRFCLLYDDGRWNLSAVNGEEKKEEGPAEDAETQQSAGTPTRTVERDLIVLLAEIHFVNAEAAIQKLRSEGVNFNQEPSPPEDRRKDVPPEEDPQWTIYREWALEMSAQATISFLRAAELGAEIREQWIISNAAVYLWNYNKHILAAGGQCQLLAPFQKLIDIMKLVGHTSEMVLQVLLCNTVAQILIPSPSPPANRVTQEKEENKKPPPPERGKKGAGKRVESVQSISMDPATVQEGKKVLELCDYAFHLTSSTDGGKAVTVAARKQVIGTWVQIKQVLQQQVGPNPDVDEECTDDTVMAMTRVLVAIEVLLSKSNSGVMESSLPTLSELVTMASECRWTDPTVELHTWTHLLHFAHVAQDHDLIMSCSQKALQCEDAALKRVKMSTCALYSDENVQQMLSSVMCMRGQSLLHKSNGHPVKYRAALSTLLCAVSNTIKTQEDAHEDLTLRAALVSLLFQIHADRGDWKTGLLVLDEALRDIPQSRHRLLLLEQRVQAKARLSQSITTDMKKFCDEGEERLASIWHCAARCSTDVARQLTCYQNAIACLQTPECKWQKVEYLLEFGEWLHCNHFPATDALHQVQWAIDLLLYAPAEEKESVELLSEETARRPVKCQSQIGVQGAVSSPSPRDLKDVKQLDGLVRAHTLLATMVDRASSHYRQHCLLAYNYVLQMWEHPSPVPPPAEEKPKQKVIVHVVPSSSEEWAQYDCPKLVRQTFRSDKSLHSINKHSIANQTQSVFFLELLVKELQSSALTHLTLPVLHLAEIISRDLMDNKSLSDLYRLRIAKCCTMLGLTTSAAYHEKCRKAVFHTKKKVFPMCPDGKHPDRDPLQPLTSHATVNLRSVRGPCTQHIWIDKAALCLSVGLYQTARILLAEANLVAKELGDHAAEAKSLYLLAVLANQEQKHKEALALLEAAQAISGDEDFWFNLSMCLAKALGGLGGPENHSRSVSVRHPGDSLDTGSRKTLMESCDILQQSSNEFLTLGHREEEAEAALQHADILRIVAKRTEDPELRRRHSLDAYLSMHKAVSVQEEVSLYAQSLPPLQESRSVSLPATRRLTRFRLALSGLALDMLEQLCEWLSTSRTLGQVAQAQLETVTSLSVNDVETRAKALCMLGRCLQLLALQKDPLYLSSNWNPQLTHKLTRILADASRNMLECYGQFDLSSAGQYLALYQSCCASAVMSEVLRRACADTAASQLAALLNVQSNLDAMKEEGAGRLLKRVEDTLLNVSKAFRNQSISPNHLNILNELPPIFKILLLQHTED
ncbi:hypothetical protein Z043_105779, partial [Scleropages formosus]